ncbi:MAG: cytochrome c [Gammaproteobacteria bacterium]|nr:cytochrome c [Gammaproteobacteria bacterium]
MRLLGREELTGPALQRRAYELENEPRSVRLRRTAKGLALAALLAASAIAAADDQDAIDYRRHVMKTLGEQLAAIDMILAKKAPADSFAVHLKVIAATATQAKKAFEPKIQGGSSKPEVWSNWPDFARRLDGLVASSDELAKAAKDAGAAAVGPKIKSTLDCESCHKVYMLPPKP